jgi:CRISPR system Cascade subunit CasB
MSERPSRAAKAKAWWNANIADRESGRARALAARLRRAEGIEALVEPEVVALAHDLNMAREAVVVPFLRLVQVLADVRENTNEPLARRLGGSEPVLSALRFQKLLRARDTDLTQPLRRAIAMAGRRCNVEHLAADLLIWDHPDWGDRVRARWCFDYFGAPPPDEAPEPAASEETEA